MLKVQVGWESSAVLTKSGEVCVFGKWGEEGFISSLLALYNLQLWGDKTIYTEPHLIEGLTGVVDISMGGDHILALTEDKEILQISAGNSHSLIKYKTKQ